MGHRAVDRARGEGERIVATPPPKAASSTRETIFTTRPSNAWSTSTTLWVRPVGVGDLPFVAGGAGPDR